MSAATLFLTCALALPVASIHHAGDDGGYNSPTRDAFIKEWEWLRPVLEQQYPDNEFFIIHNTWEITPPGWIWVPFGWDGHLIYRRPISRAA